MFLERQTECSEQRVALLVRAGGGHESDLQTVDARVLVDVDLREDDLLLETEGVVALTVHLLGDAVEVADTRESHTHQTLEELVHADVAEGDLRTDGHALTELEVGDILAGVGDNCLLTGDDGELFSGLFDHLLVLGGVTDTFVEGNLYKAGNLHYGMIGELLHQSGNDFLERLIRVALPRIRDFNGISEKMDGQGNYTLGIKEQIIFPEIEIDKNPRIHGVEITFVTTAKTDEEAHALLKAFGLPFKKHNN